MNTEQLLEMSMSMSATNKARLANRLIAGGFIKYDTPVNFIPAGVIWHESQYVNEVASAETVFSVWNDALKDLMIEEEAEYYLYYLKLFKMHGLIGLDPNVDEFHLCRLTRQDKYNTILENNTCAPSGQWRVSILSRTIANFYGIHNSWVDPVDTLLKIFLDTWKNHSGKKPRLIAIVYPSQEVKCRFGPKIEHSFIANRWTELGVPCIAVTFEQAMEMEEEIDIFYIRMIVEDLIKYIHKRPDIVEIYKRCLTQRNKLFTQTPEGMLAGDKLFMKWVYFWATKKRPEALKFLTNTWSLEDFIISNLTTKFVVKPRVSFGGQNVLVGTYFSSDDEFRATVSEAVGENSNMYVVQKAMDAIKVVVPFWDENGISKVFDEALLNIGSYVAFGHSYGWLFRVSVSSSNGVISVTSGNTSLQPVYLAD